MCSGFKRKVRVGVTFLLPGAVSAVLRGLFAWQPGRRGQRSGANRCVKQKVWFWRYLRWWGHRASRAIGGQRLLSPAGRRRMIGGWGDLIGFIRFDSELRAG
jgi:hypothetical protein